MDMETFEQNMNAIGAINDELGEQRIFMPPIEDLDAVQDGVRSQCTLKGTFAADDPALMDEVRQLIEEYGSVILLLNPAELSFDVFVPAGRQIIEELVALSKELGDGRIYLLGDNQSKEALEMLKQLSFMGTFSGSDLQVVTRVRSLADRHTSVIVFFNLPNIEVFVTPNG